MLIGKRMCNRAYLSVEKNCAYGDTDLRTLCVMWHFAVRETCNGSYR